MEFKLEYSAVPEDRCQACVVKGGFPIRNEKQARRFLRLHDVDEVKVGTVLTLPTCEPEPVLALIREKYGRPCPRVELDVENGPAASLASLVISSHLSPLIDPLYEAATVDLTAEQRLALVYRVIHALQDSRVVDLLQAQREKAAAEAREK